MENEQRDIDREIKELEAKMPQKKVLFAYALLETNFNKAHAIKKACNYTNKNTIKQYGCQWWKDKKVRKLADLLVEKSGAKELINVKDLVNRLQQIMNLNPADFYVDGKLDLSKIPDDLAWMISGIKFSRTGKLYFETVSKDRAIDNLLTISGLKNPENGIVNNIQFVSIEPEEEELC